MPPSLLAVASVVEAELFELAYFVAPASPAERLEVLPEMLGPWTAFHTEPVELGYFEPQ